MKANIFLIFCLFLAVTAAAQGVSLKKDTIYTGREKYALFSKSPRPPFTYTISTLDGTELIRIHDGRIQVKGAKGYVVTFLNDNKQGMIAERPNFPRSMVAELVKCQLVEKGNLINAAAKEEFLYSHPLPVGYTDVDQLIEY